MALELTQRFRRDVAPYDVVTSLTCLSGTSVCPAMQTYTAGGSPKIDRGSVPTVLLASLTASAKDRSGSITSVTDTSVTSVTWMVQKGSETKGTDITLHPDWTGFFTVGTGSDQGKLTITKNVAPGEMWKIWMTCAIADARRGYIVPVTTDTDSVLLYSITEAKPKYVMSIDRPSAEVYELATDARLIHDYLSGLGMAPSEFADDGNTYLRTVNVRLRQGGAAVDASDYTISIYRIAPNGSKLLVVPGNDANIDSVSGEAVTFNLLFADNAVYQIAAIVDGTEVAHKTYSWVWSQTMPYVPRGKEGMAGADTYRTADTQGFREALFFGRGKLQCPLVGFKLEWGYRKQGQSTTAFTYLGAGEEFLYPLTDSNLFANGSTVSDAVLHVTKRGTFSHLYDGTDRYVDGDGNHYIEN